MITYKGFSTYNRARKFKINDFELVKQDLFNHFHIRKGEKLMNPNFGTIIWDMIYEPYTDTLRDAIEDDIKRIVSYDPRIAVDKITVTEFTDGLFIELDLRYVVTNQLTKMTMQFDRDAKTLTTGS
jgi:phage baseplate assembly protein W